MKTQSQTPRVSGRRQALDFASPLRQFAAVPRLALWLGAIVMALLLPNARAVTVTNLINLQIGNGGGTQTGAAVVGAPGDTWNDLTGNSSSIVNSVGAAQSGVSISFAGAYSLNYPVSKTTDAGTAALMSYCGYNYPSAWTITVGGLGSFVGDSFNLVLFGSGPVGGTAFSITGASGGNSGSTLNTTGGAQISAGVGVAYQVYSNATLSASSLVITVAPGSFQGCNGFQLQIATSVADPAITIQPAAEQLLVPGQTISFSVAAVGQSTLSYQWQGGPVGGPYTNLSNAGKISGATSSTMSLANATADWAGAYQVIVSDLAGSITSSPSILVTGELIDVQFPGVSGAPGGAGVAQTGAAILGTAGDIWNQEAVPYFVQSANPISAAPLQNTGGGPSGVTLTLGAYASNPTYGNAYAGDSDVTDPGTTNLMSSDVEVFNYFAVNPYLNFTFANLPASAVGSPFTLVVYAAAPTNNAGTETITLTSGATGGNTGSALTTTSASRKLSDGIGVAYNTFTGILTGNSLAINVTGLGTAQYSVGAYVNGFQLQLSSSDPFIATNPVPQTTVSGGTASFSVGAAGSTPLSYQWQAGTGVTFTNLVNGPQISGATSNILTLSNVSTNWALEYQVIVSNGEGSVTSSPPATLTVLGIPLINTEPVSQLALIGGTASFNVGASGVGTLSYQWQAGTIGSGTYANLSNVGGSIAGALSNVLTLSNVTTNSALAYQVIVSNANGSVTSAPPATLTVYPASALIDVQIGNLVGTQTGTAVLGISTNDVWNDLTANSSAIVDSANVPLSNVSVSFAGYYVLNYSSQTTTDPGTADLMGSAGFNYFPGGGAWTITISGLGAYVNTPLNLVAYGAGPVTGAAFSLTGATGGNTGSTLATTGANGKLSSGIGVAYQIFSGSLSSGTLVISVASSPGNVFPGCNGFQIQLAPVVASLPLETTVQCGTGTTLSAFASSTAPLQYQWYDYNTNAIPNATNSTLVLPSVTFATAGSYSVIVSNALGTASAFELINVVDTPTIVSSFTNLTLIASAPGCTALMPDVTGTNYIVVADPCGGSLLITQLPTNNAVLPLGTNSVILTVTNNTYGGAATSIINTITVVEAAPTIVTQPVSQTNSIGSNVTFTVSAEACTALSYQWYFGANPIANETNASLSFTAATNNAGNYYVQVTSGGGPTNSQTVVLTVPSAPLLPPVLVSGKLLSDKTFQLTINGASNQTYHVLSSTNVTIHLTNWVVLTSGTFSGVQTTYTDTTATNHNANYYRLVSP